MVTLKKFLYASTLQRDDIIFVTLDKAVVSTGSTNRDSLNHRGA